MRVWQSTPRHSVRAASGCLGLKFAYQSPVQTSLCMDPLLRELLDALSRDRNPRWGPALARYGRS